MAALRPKLPKSVRPISESTSTFGQLTYRFRTQTFIPSGSRKDEQGFLKVREALCLTPAFRLDIQELRKRYPADYWEQGRHADRDAEEYGKKWQITAPQLILWLVQHWDPSGSNPPLQLPTFTMEPELARQLERLCQNSAFRCDIQALQQRYPASYWIKGYELSSEAQQLCARWGIDGLYWVIWLVEHWDPDKVKLPPFEPSDQLPRVTPVLRNWVLEIESIVDDAEKRKAGKPLRAMLTLYPGVSLRDVQVAAKVALRVLGPSKQRKGARPGLTEIDRSLIRREFEKLGIPSHRKRTQMAQTVARLMKQIGRPVSESAIAHELRQWLKEKGQSVKTYWTEKKGLPQ